MSARVITSDIHTKALDYLYEIEGIDPWANDIHKPATVATILYMLLENKEEDENESI